jgi:uncharacterized protein YbjT (DUF2867 family)
MTNRTIAITGGTGFVGSAVIDFALTQGWRVRALTRLPRNHRDGVTWITGTLSDMAALEELARGSDAVIHCAGVVNVATRGDFELGNVAGTLAIVEATKRACVARFVHVSSLSAREPNLSNYGWSKARAEAVVQASGLDWTMVRPPAIYGPSDRDMLDIFKMAKTGFVLMPPRGNISVIEVSDLARLLVALVSDAGSRAHVYEVDDGMDGGWTHAAFGKAIGWAVGGAVTPVHTPRPLMLAVARLDRLFRRSKAKLTQDRVSYLCHPNWVIDPNRRPPSSLWVPQVATRAGLKATARAYRRKGWMT